MRKGFTLVEILVVLVIIGILVALILPNALNAIRQANIRECESNLRSIDSSAMMCYTATRNWGGCDTTGELVAGNYLEAVPTCAVGGPAYALVLNPATGGYAADRTGHAH